MSDSELPEGWTKKISRSSNKPYYVNKWTNKRYWSGKSVVQSKNLILSQWDRPSRPAEKPQKTEEVQCSHLLVKHRDSRRPASWRCDNITISKEEALGTYYLTMYFPMSLSF